MVYLPHDGVELYLHVAHTDKNILKAAHINLLMLGINIQILVCQAGEQVVDVIDDGAQSFYQ
jgi:hypothetical protein